MVEKLKINPRIACAHDSAMTIAHPHASMRLVAAGHLS